jgi:invasion protein IalB
MFFTWEITKITTSSMLFVVVTWHLLCNCEEDHELCSLFSFITTKKEKKRMMTSSMASCRRSFILRKKLK